MYIGFPTPYTSGGSEALMSDKQKLKFYIAHSRIIQMWERERPKFPY